MKIFVVLHQDFLDCEVTVLDAYDDEEKANNRVKWEHGLSDGLVWYEETVLIK